MPRYLNGQIREVNVASLLNSVEVARSSGKRSAEVFVSYSHKDDELRAELDAHLKLLQRIGVIDVWNDRRISASDDWKNEIDRNLNDANLVIFLVSSDFLASDYCFGLEMKRALERQGNGEVCVLTVILRDCNWERAPFSHLQALPTGARAVRLWSDRDSAWASVARGIERLISSGNQV